MERKINRNNQYPNNSTGETAKKLLENKLRRERLRQENKQK